MTKNADTQIYCSTIYQRISTKNRDDAIIQLQSAYGDGRLDENELEARIAKVMSAKVQGDLLPLLNDIEPIFEINKGKNLKKTHKTLAIFSGVEHNGEFVLPSKYEIKAIVGGCSIDLRQAQFENHISDIDVTAILGGVEIFVPKNVRVLVRGTPILGGISQKISTADMPQDGVLIRINARVILGGIEIRTKD